MHSKLSILAMLIYNITGQTLFMYMYMSIIYVIYVDKYTESKSTDIKLVY